MTKERLSGAFDMRVAEPSTPVQPDEPNTIASLMKSALHPRLSALSMVTRISTWRVRDPDALRLQLEQKRAAIAAMPEVLGFQVAWTPNGDGITFAVFSSDSAAARFNSLSIFTEATEFVSPVTTAAYPDVAVLK